MSTQQMGFEQAHALCKQARPLVAINRGFQLQVRIERYAVFMMV